MQRLTARVAAVLAVACLAYRAEAEPNYAFTGTIEVGSTQIIPNNASNGGINQTGKGRQTFTAGVTLGLDFLVGDDAILVTALGVWDDNGDGINAHVLSLWDTSTQTLLATVMATASGGLPAGGYVYFDLANPLLLRPGTAFTVGVLYGPGNTDSNGNSGAPSQNYEPTPDFNGAGLVQNVGTARFVVGDAFPASPDGGPPNRYHAGSFAFMAAPVPEPATIALLATALAALALVVRRR